MKILKESFRFNISYITKSISSTTTEIVISNNAFDNGEGVLMIDGIDSYGTSTPALREFITYNGLEEENRQWTLKNVKRGQYGSLVQPHGAGARVEALPVIREENIQTEKEKSLENYLKQIL